jgi:hypothetical protein
VYASFRILMAVWMKKNEISCKMKGEGRAGLLINESVLDTDFFTKNKYAQIYFNLPNSTA